MYNDEKNLYHYTYRKDGSEPWDARTAVDAPYRESRDEGPGKKAKKNRGGAKIVALALSCALLGGAAGAGVAVWGGFGGGNSTDVYMSNRTAATVSV